MVFDPEAGEKSEGLAENGELKDGQTEETDGEMEEERDGEMEEESDREMEEEREGEMERAREGEMERAREGEMERAREGEMERVRDGEMERARDGEMEEESNGEMEEGGGEGEGQVFSPLVTIIHPDTQQLDLQENSHSPQEPQENILEPSEEPQSHNQCRLRYPETNQSKQIPNRRCGCCGEIVTLSVCLSAATVLFPLLVWAGFELLPFDVPPLSSAPFRLVYTLRCGFFASLPIVLGLMVQGVSRFKFAALKPLFEGNRGLREVIAHSNYVRDSLHLFVLYFAQLAVLATYIQHGQLKLVPLLTIVFVFGRLIYWVCVVLGSSVRSLGFGLSFLPVLVLLGVNMHFICSSSGPEAVFGVAPPTTPPPKRRWWG